MGETKYGSIRSITYIGDKVKINNPINKTAMQKALESAGVVDEYGISNFSLKDEEKSTIKEQLKQHQGNLNEMNVIASINTSKKFKNAKEALEWAVKQLKITGYKAERQGFGTIIFDEKRLKNGLQYIKLNQEYTAFALIPKVIKRGIVVGEHSNHKDRGYATVTLAAPIEIDGVRGNMAVVVRVEGKNYYKLHKVLMPDEIFDNKSGAYWFSESLDYAEAMSEERKGNTIIQAYLNMRKLYRVTLQEGQFSDPVYEKPHIEYAKKNGYDGVIFKVETDNELVKDTFYVVFDSSQIKSATDNIGTFDNNNKSVNFSLKGGVEISSKRTMEFLDTVEDMKNGKKGAEFSVRFFQLNSRSAS